MKRRSFFRTLVGAPVAAAAVQTAPVAIEQPFSEDDTGASYTTLAEMMRQFEYTGASYYLRDGSAWYKQTQELVRWRTERRNAAEFRQYLADLTSKFKSI